MDPEAPAYTLRDLAADAAALVAALDHPAAFSALTLVGTRAVAPGPVDDDLPEHDQEVMSQLFAQPMPDWTDREAVAVPEGRRELSRRHAAVVGDGAKPQLGDQFEIVGRCRSDPHSSG